VREVLATPCAHVSPVAPPQMFCTQCAVAFSWRTGAVVTNGVIHNPHYYEYLRRTRGEVPRAPGDVPCGGAPTAYDLDAALRRAEPPMQPADLRRLREIHRVLRHVQAIDLPRLRRDAQNDNDRNVDLRLQYLLNQIDRDEWRKKLQQREKRRERAFAVMQVYDMFCGLATDTLRGIVSDAISPEEGLQELKQLQGFADTSLDAISKRFNMRVKRLRPEYA